MLYLFAKNDMNTVVTTKGWLSSNFNMKDMGKVNLVLGVKILRDCSGRLLGLSQETCIKKILKWFQMQNCKPIDTLTTRKKIYGDIYNKSL